jgi:septum formation protein
MTAPPALILASTSRYRRLLLTRLTAEFEVHASNVDESPEVGEAPTARALRLALAKARTVAESHPQAVVIGSDQVAAAGTVIYDKPGTAAAAREQLERLSGSSVQFHSAVAVLRLTPAFSATRIDTTRVVFRPLSRAEIERYVAREQPLDTAASMKTEGLGISLLERIESQDPTSIIGLPLIWVAEQLRALGFLVP